MLHTNDPILGLYRNATKPLTDFINVLLAGAERLQNAQLTTTHELLSSQDGMERQLQEASSIREAMDIQGKATRDGWTKAISGLSGIYAASSINQMEWIRQAQSQTLQMVDNMTGALEELPGDVAPLATSLKLAIDTVRATCTTNIRVTEEAERMATSRLENVISEAPVVSTQRQSA